MLQLLNKNTFSVQPSTGLDIRWWAHLSAGAHGVLSWPWKHVVSAFCYYNQTKFLQIIKKILFLVHHFESYLFTRYHLRFLFLLHFHLLLAHASSSTYSVAQVTKKVFTSYIVSVFRMTRLQLPSLQIFSVAIEPTSSNPSSANGPEAGQDCRFALSFLLWAALTVLGSLRSFILPTNSVTGNLGESPLPPAGVLESHTLWKRLYSEALDAHGTSVLNAPDLHIWLRIVNCNEIWKPPPEDGSINAGGFSAIIIKFWCAWTRGCRQRRPAAPLLNTQVVI